MTFCFQNRVKSSQSRGTQGSRGTRRLYVGWKHQCKGKAVAQQITAGKGGGVVHVDFENNLDLEQMMQRVVNLYFPGGRCDKQMLDLCDVKYFMATFTGKRLCDVMPDGQMFTVGEFCRQQGHTPVRVYLHTQSVNSLDAEVCVAKHIIMLPF